LLMLSKSAPLNLGQEPLATAGMPEKLAKKLPI